MDGKETRQGVHVKRKTEARLRYQFCLGKAISITYSECVFVALGIRLAKRVTRITLASVACLAVIFIHLIS